jgi:hypothetical protein
MEIIDKNKVSKINLAWINFLELFFAGQSNISYEQNENGYVTYTIENVSNTSITLSNKYGFLSLIFDDLKTIDKFIEITKSMYENLHKDERQGIYQANKLTINFYDRSIKFSDKMKFTERIVVFQSVMEILIRIKISKEKFKFLDHLEP